MAPAGDAFLVVTGSSRIKVYDRDGKERGESIQGDMYIRDQRNTKGHVSPCTTGQWHPVDRYEWVLQLADCHARMIQVCFCHSKFPGTNLTPRSMSASARNAIGAL